MKRRGRYSSACRRGARDGVHTGRRLRAGAGQRAPCPGPELPADGLCKRPARRRPRADPRLPSLARGARRHALPLSRLVAGGPIAAPEPADIAVPHGRPIPALGYWGDPAMPRDASTPLEGRYTDNDSWSTNELDVDWQGVTSTIFIWRAGGPLAPRRRVPPWIADDPQGVASSLRTPPLSAAKAAIDGQFR